MLVSDKTEGKIVSLRESSEYRARLGCAKYIGGFRR